MTRLPGTDRVHATDLYGCPSGAVCIYARDQPAGSGTLTDTYWSAGAHNLSDHYGWHWVVNNRHGGAGATLCHRFDGGDCTGPTIPAGSWVAADLGPVHSIRLDP
ncbi:hypothetical protein ACF9IK_12425 [Kitasatospora hibisci]|uniref:hypothetical protein n=1 Tax=Kitasatospora hibisci TaxID=3369522 RepID=UPI003754426D